MSEAYSVTAEELRQFIERVEQLNYERSNISEQIREVFAEAKGRGYDQKAMKKLIAQRKRRAEELAEEEAIVEMYRSALGMA